MMIIGTWVTTLHWWFIQMKTERPNSNTTASPFRSKLIGFCFRMKLIKSDLRDFLLATKHFAHIDSIVCHLVIFWLKIIAKWNTKIRNGRWTLNYSLRISYRCGSVPFPFLASSQMATNIFWVRSESRFTGKCNMRKVCVVDIWFSSHRKCECRKWHDSIISFGSFSSIVKWMEINTSTGFNKWYIATHFTKCIFINFPIYFSSLFHRALIHPKWMHTKRK